MGNTRFSDKETIGVLKEVESGLGVGEVCPEARELANRLVERLGKATGDEAVFLGRALAALAAQVKGDQAERGANRLVELLGKATEYDVVVLGEALAPLTAELNPMARKRVLAKFIETREPMPCNAAVVNAESSEVELVVDMLKWPVCTAAMELRSVLRNSRGLNRLNLVSSSNPVTDQPFKLTCENSSLGSRPNATRMENRSTLMVRQFGRRVT